MLIDNLKETGAIEEWGDAVASNAIGPNGVLRTRDDSQSPHRTLATVMVREHG